jgi:hypothetical protein
VPLLVGAWAAVAGIRLWRARRGADTPRDGPSSPCARASRPPNSRRSRTARGRAACHRTRGHGAADLPRRGARRRQPASGRDPRSVTCSSGSTTPSSRVSSPTSSRTSGAATTSSRRRSGRARPHLLRPVRWLGHPPAAPRARARRRPGRGRRDRTTRCPRQRAAQGAGGGHRRGRTRARPWLPGAASSTGSGSSWRTRPPCRPGGPPSWSRSPRPSRPPSSSRSSCRASSQVPSGNATPSPCCGRHLPGTPVPTRPRWSGAKPRAFDVYRRSSLDAEPRSVVVQTQLDEHSAENRRSTLRACGSEDADCPAPNPASVWAPAATDHHRRRRAHPPLGGRDAGRVRLPDRGRLPRLLAAARRGVTSAGSPDPADRHRRRSLLPSARPDHPSS